jgi:hypothetical protein
VRFYSLSFSRPLLTSLSTSTAALVRFPPFLLLLLSPLLVLPSARSLLTLLYIHRSNPRNPRSRFRPRPPRPRVRLHPHRLVLREDVLHRRVRGGEAAEVQGRVDAVHGVAVDGQGGEEEGGLRSFLLSFCPLSPPFLPFTLFSHHCSYICSLAVHSIVVLCRFPLSLLVSTFSLTSPPRV